MQTFSILMWREAENTPLDFLSVSERAFNTINVYNALPSQYRPNYLAANSKKSTRKINCDSLTIQELLKKEYTKANKKSFPELGFGLQMFSSLDDKESFGYALHIGNTDKRFCNNAIINIAINFDMFILQNAEMIKELFVHSVKEFHPFWGCVCNNGFRTPGKGYFSDGIPKSIHWLNYWSPTVAERVGWERIKSVESHFQQVHYSNGFLQIQDTPIDSTNSDDVALVNLIQKELLS